MTFKIKDGVAIGTNNVFDNTGILQDTALPDKVTSSTYTSVTVDAKGRVTAGTNPGFLTSQSSDVKTITVTDTDTGFTWTETGSASASSVGDTITFVSGGGMDIDVDATNKAIKFTAVATAPALDDLTDVVITTPATGATLIYDGSNWVDGQLNLGDSDAITGTLPIGNGGTGQTTANAALNALLPAQATHNGKALVTDGSNTSWVSLADNNTTYGISAETTTGGANLRLTGSDASTDDVKFASGGIAVVSRTDANTITITATEADTLSSVTGRGATTATALTFTNATASTNTTSGALVVTGGVGVGGNVNVGGNISVTGNLTVNGTTTTVNSTTVTIDDPVFTLGGDTAPGSDDSKDRGIEFRWHNGSTAKLGFFGFDDSTGKFTFIPDATNTSEVFSGTKGELDASVDWSNVLNKPDPTITLGGDLTGSVTLTDLGSATLTATIAANSVALGTDTTGDYVASVSQGTGITVTGTGEGAAVTVTHADTSTVSNLTSDNSGNTFIQDIAFTFDGMGHVTAASVVTGTVSGFLTAEADTLATVTGRGATTATAVSITNTTEATSNATGALIIDGGVSVDKNIFLSGSVVSATSAGSAVAYDAAVRANLSTVSQTAVDTWAVATYRSAKYLIQITQGTNYQVSEVMVIHNGTTTTMTEFAVLETNGALATFTADVNAGNARLLCTMGSATAAVINIKRTLMVV